MSAPVYFLFRNRYTSFTAVKIHKIKYDMKGLPTEVCKLLERNVEAYFAGGYRVVRKDVRFGKRVEGL